MAQPAITVKETFFCMAKTLACPEPAAGRQSGRSITVQPYYTFL
jgi:hypothetical protein